MVRLTRVKTAAGVTLQNPEAEVYIKVGNSPKGSIYTSTKARNMQPWGQAPWDKKYVDISLEEIAESLNEFPPYVAAQDATFLKNDKGELIPRFKHHLIKGLWDQVNQQSFDTDQARKNSDKLRELMPFLATLSESALEEKILGNADEESPDRIADFSRHEYGRMTKAIHDVIVQNHTADNAPLVTSSAVRHWIKGEHNGPRERNLFYSLFDVNPVFQDYLQSLPGQENPWESYKLWTIVRQGLGNTFSPSTGRRRGIKPKIDNLTEGGKKTSLSPYILHVLDTIQQDVSDQHINVLVTGIDQVDIDPSNMPPGTESLEGAAAGSNRKVHLYKGLCNERPEDLDGPFVEFTQIPNMLRMVSCALEFGIYRFLNTSNGGGVIVEIGRNAGIESDEEWSEYSGWMLPHNIASLLTYTRSTSNVGWESAPHVQAKTFRALSAASHYILQKTLEGEFDRQIGTPEGTMAGALETAAGLSSALPPEFFEMILTEGHIQTIQYTLEGATTSNDHPIDKRALEGQLRQLKKTEAAQQKVVWGDTFNLAPAKLFLHDHVVANPKVWDAVKNPFSVFYDNSPILDDLVLTIKDGGTESRYIRYMDAKEAFENLGLDRLLRVIPVRDFIDQIVPSTESRELYARTKKIRESQNLQ